MNKTLKIVTGVVLSTALIVTASLGTIWSHRNTAVELEERITAQYTANQSNYDSMWKKFKELVQVSDLQADQVKEVYTGLITGRYKDDKVLFKMVKEDNPQIDTGIYAQMQREISAGRNTFDNNQKKVTDIVREYNTYVRKHIIMASMTGRQPKDMSEYIITSDKTSKAFETGKDDEIKLK